MRGGSLASPSVAAVAGMCDKCSVAGRFLTLLDGWLARLEDADFFEAHGDEHDDAEDSDDARCPDRNILA